MIEDDAIVNTHHICIIYHYQCRYISISISPSALIPGKAFHET